MPIDLATGRLRAFGRTKPAFGGTTYTAHPDTGFVFADVRIPFWDELQELVRAAARELAPLRAIGWDVAITPDRPVLIEANHTYEGFGLQGGSTGLGPSPAGALIRAGRARRRRVAPSDGLPADAVPLPEAAP